MKTTSAVLALAATALASTTIQHHKSILADAPPQIFNTAGTAINGTTATTLILDSTTTGIYANSTTATTTASTTKSKTKSSSTMATVTGSSSTDDESGGSPLVTGAGGSGSGSQPSAVPHSGASSEMFGGLFSGFKGWVLSAVIVALAV